MNTAVRFDGMDRRQLEVALAAAPAFARFAPAAKRAIRVIHGLPTLFRGRSLRDIQVYIGRTAARPGSLRGRWNAHAAGKRHQFGTVLFTCATGSVQSWERAANRLIKRLERRGALCVANATAGGQGPLPAHETSCIYLTWTFVRRQACAPIARHELAALLAEVRIAGPNEPSVDSWARALVPLPDPRDRVRLRWCRRPKVLS